jgi:hypothetical protein
MEVETSHRNYFLITFSFCLRKQLLILNFCEGNNLKIALLFLYRADEGLYIIGIIKCTVLQND